jgi:peptidyl-tRNA hydrolase
VPPPETGIAPAVLHHFIIVRADLPIGVLASQVTHAAGESSPGNLPEGTNAVVLSVPDEAGLEAVSKRLALAGTEHVRIVENEGKYAGQFLAIGCKPGRKKEVGRALRHLPLLE